MKPLAIAAALALVTLQPVSASAPVRKTMMGCVSIGAFRSEAGHIIKVRTRPGVLADLSRWNGKRIRISGDLLPGDNFYLRAKPAVLGLCR
jgi:hypothetical protein